MTKLSSVATAVENKRYTFVAGKISLQLLKLAVRNTDGAGDVAFVKFGSLGSRIDDSNIGFGLDHFFYHTGLDSIVVAGGAFPFGESVFEYFNVLVTKFFCLPGRFVTQLSSGALTIKNKQGFLILRQTAQHAFKFAVRNADGSRNVTLVIFWTLGS